MYRLTANQNAQFYFRYLLNSESLHHILMREPYGRSPDCYTGPVEDWCVITVWLARLDQTVIQDQLKTGVS